MVSGNYTGIFSTAAPRPNNSEKLVWQLKGEVRERTHRLKVIKIIDADESQTTARRDRIITEDQLSHSFQVTLSDVEIFIEYVLKGITSPHGLTYSEYIDGDYIMVTISAR